MKQKIVAGNWKMNTTPSEGTGLVASISRGLQERDDSVRVMVFPPLTHQAVVSPKCGQRIELGAQDCSQHPHGAYTGEVSAAMLKDCGCRLVIIGHSERRMYHGEDQEILSGKIAQALKSGLEIIFCVGEQESVRMQGEQAAWKHVQAQLELLTAFDKSLASSLIVAYEPIWAIGTGKTARPEDASWMCSNIDRWLEENLGAAGKDVPVLYGGSCNAKNAKELFAQPGVCGGLIGGASLKAEDFLQIIDSF